MFTPIATILDRDHLNAFCRHTHAEVKGAARGPLAKLTCGVKDLFDIAGHRTGFGSPEWLQTHPPATHTAPAVQRLIDAGADVVGKTQTHELALSLSGENIHYGTPVNINAPGRIPGGSSSGSAAATAGGLVDFALGSDTGGSVRAPAAFCGVYGMRPTHGRVPLAGACAVAPSFDTVGWFARDAELLDRVGQVLLGGKAAARPLRRILIATDAFDCAEPAAACALKSAVELLYGTFDPPRPITLTGENLQTWFDAFHVLRGAEAWAMLGSWVTQVQPALDPVVEGVLRWGAALSSDDVSAMQHRRETITRGLADLLRDDAILVLPTMPGIAPPLKLPRAALEAFRTSAMSLLSIAGLAGLPQISLPVARLEGCPLGLSLIGPRGADEALLATVRAMTSQLSPRPPPAGCR
jgi:amidase